MDKIKIGGNTNHDYCPELCEAGVDTAFPYITGPYDKIKQLNSDLGALGPVGEIYQMWVFRCNETSSLPTVVFTFNGNTFSLTHEDYLLQDYPACWSVFVGFSTPPDSPWLLGVPFIGAFYAEFDFGKKCIGFARAKK